LPDPAVLFFSLMLLIWVLSAVFSTFTFSEIDPRSGAPIVVNNLLTGKSLAAFLSGMVTTFTGFAPLGIVLVAMLGVGVAENAGYINAGLKYLLSLTPKSLLTPMLILVAVVSHTAADAGYVLVIPLGGVIFYAAGRHPVAGIAAAFAGVAGGFSANFIPSGIDPLLQGFTQAAAQIINPEIQLNPLNNWFFTSASTLLIVALGWFITDKIVEPRLRTVPVDDDMSEQPKVEALNKVERRALLYANLTMVLLLFLLFLWVRPADSALRSEDGQLATFAAPIMRSIIPLIFILFIIPGIVYGFAAGIYKKSKDVISSMTKSINSMSYYIVMAFFCALFIDAFSKSNLGALLALKGASFLQSMNFPGEVTIVGILFLTAFVNLFIGSASAKWALLAPIFVPMLMQVGLSPDLTQAAYRVGDSISNVITPLNPYFPLVVVYCHRYVKATGIGTLVSTMLPYTFIFGLVWTLFLLVYWMLGLPLGLKSTYDNLP
ncbi:MAG: AbgT family transporter, partial [Chitinophagales bacterium]